MLALLVIRATDPIIGDGRHDLIAPFEKWHRRAGTSSSGATRRLTGPDGLGSHSGIGSGLG